MRTRHVLTTTNCGCGSAGCSTPADQPEREE
jgi:hypothetical protein